MKFIEVEGTKRSQPKNGFFWHVVVKAKKDITNPRLVGKVKYGNGGFDTYSNALRAARNHNKELKVPYPIYHRGKLVK